MTRKQEGFLCHFRWVIFLLVLRAFPEVVEIKFLFFWLKTEELTMETLFALGEHIFVDGEYIFAHAEYVFGSGE